MGHSGKQKVNRLRLHALSAVKILFTCVLNAHPNHASVVARKQDLALWAPFPVAIASTALQTDRKPYFGHPGPAY